MALRDRLEALHGVDGVFNNGDSLIEKFYEDCGLEVEFDSSYQDGYCTWQVDSKFDNGRAQGTVYPMADIVAWGFQQLIEAMLDG